MRVTSRRAVTVAAVLALGAIAAACVPVTSPPPTTQPPPGPPVPPPLVSRSTIVSGLNKPWDIAFVPGATGIAGSMLYTENDAGTVSVYLNATQPRRVLATLPGIDISGEGGAMGLAVDPEFATNHYVYVCYTAASDNRVSRFVATLDGAGRPLSLAFDDDIITGMLKASVHNGCRIRFQPNTSPPALFVTMGDAAVGTSPQDPTGLNGKVLRVDRDGNPYGNASGQHWYTRGHRNPQGIAFRPADNVPYSAEHGPNVNDEINRLFDGGNSGWNPVPLPYDQSVPMTDPAVDPGNVFAPVWASGGSTIAISGIEFLNGPAWGSWQGNIVGAMLKNHELRMWRIDPATGGWTGSTVELFDDGGTRLRVPVIGPDGALYVATDASSPAGAIWRITRN